MNIFVYQLKLTDESLYIGMTKNWSKRLREHQRGSGSIHTKGKVVASWAILWNGPVVNKYHAMLIENKIAEEIRSKMKGITVRGGELSARYKKIIIKRAFQKGR